MVVVGLCLLLWTFGWLFRPDLTYRPPPWTEAQKAHAQAERNVTFDPAAATSLHRKMKVVPSGESPLLAEMVQKGQLPSLEQRLPEDQW